MKSLRCTPVFDTITITITIHCSLRCDRLIASKLSVSDKRLIVSSIMNPRCTTGWISSTSKRCIPAHSSFSRTCNTLSSRYCLLCSLSWINFFEDHTITVSFFCSWYVSMECRLEDMDHLVYQMPFGCIILVSSLLTPSPFLIIYSSGLMFIAASKKSASKK